MSYYVEKDNAVLSESKVELAEEKCFWKNQCMVFAHLHSSIEVLIIRKGSFRIEIDNESSTVREGDVVLIRPNTIHQIFSLDGGETGYLVYKIRPELILDFADGDVGVKYLLELNYRKGKSIWRSEEIEGGRLSSIAKMIISDSLVKPYAAELSVKANAVLLLVELLRCERRDPSDDGKIRAASLRKIYEAINIVNARFREGITAEECAREVDMCYTHFSRSFKSVIGKSFTRYLNEVRINSAEKELYMTDKSIAEIAYGVGFGDSSYFIATYKKMRGKTPAKMRNAIHT